MQKKRLERQEDEGEYAQEGDGEAETIAAVAAPNKGSASRHVGKIDTQLQQLQHLTKAQLQGVWAKLKLSRSSCSTLQRLSFKACGQN